MSSRYNHGSHFETHPAATELERNPEHQHIKAEEHRGHQDHLTGHEASVQAAEHTTQELHPHAHTQHGYLTFGHAEIEALAHQFWEERGRPEGSPEEDWHRAVAELRLRKAE